MPPQKKFVLGLAGDYISKGLCGCSSGMEFLLTAGALVDFRSGREVTSNMPGDHLWREEQAYKDMFKAAEM